MHVLMLHAMSSGAIMQRNVHFKLMARRRHVDWVLGNEQAGKRTADQPTSAHAVFRCEDGGFKWVLHGST
jgi:hypothetical protein